MHVKKFQEQKEGHTFFFTLFTFHHYIWDTCQSLQFFEVSICLEERVGMKRDLVGPYRVSWKGKASVLVNLLVCPSLLFSHNPCQWVSGHRTAPPNTAHSWLDQLWVLDSSWANQIHLPSIWNWNLEILLDNFGPFKERT